MSWRGNDTELGVRISSCWADTTYEEVLVSEQQRNVLCDTAQKSKTIFLNIKNQIKMRRVHEILEDINNDRYIFVQYNKGQIVGLNFHQGLGHIDYNYFTPSEAISKIYKALENEQECSEIAQRVLIDQSIKLYLDLFHN